MTEERPPDPPVHTPPDFDRTSSPPPAADRWRVPPSFWIWLAMLLLTYAVPRITELEGRSTKIVKGSSVATSAGTLQELFQAEYQARLALSPILSAQGLPDAKTGKPGSAAATAANAYRDIAIEKQGVASARKALVLEHLQKKPLDEAFLTGVLARNLSERGETPGSIGSEVALWRALYGKNAGERFDPSKAELLVGRVKALKLGLLEQQVVADVYALAGRDAEATRVRKALQDRVTAEVFRLVLLILLLLAGAVVGAVLLILLAITWRNKKWENVGRLRRAPLAEGGADAALPFGSLMDVFVAYLALSRGVGLLAGILPGLDAASPVYLSAAVYVGSGVLATLYLLARARARRWETALLGMRTTGISDVFYGLAGYCAALPVVFALGAINNSVFKKNDSSLAPNPVLPMIAGEGSDFGRLVLFCLVAIAAPLFEELFFRGVLYSALKTRFSTAPAVVLSAGCFAVVHPMGDWLPIFGLGCVLATVRELRQSLVPGIVLHFCQNAMAFTMMSTLFGK